jgi:transposase
MRKVAYKRRNEAERFLRRIKEFRRIATRYEKLDVAFITRLVLAFIFIVSQSQRQTRRG